LSWRDPDADRRGAAPPGRRRRAAGRDKSAPPLPAGESFQPSPEQMAEAAAEFGNIILGPPR